MGGGRILPFLYNFFIPNIYAQAIKSYLHSKTDHPFNDTRVIFAQHTNFFGQVIGNPVFYSDSSSWNTDQEVVTFYEFLCVFFRYCKQLLKKKPQRLTTSFFNEFFLYTQFITDGHSTFETCC
jgi:hypothetical protein